MATTSADQTAAAARVNFFGHANEAGWVRAACDAVLGSLAAERSRGAGAVLLLSGGQTPLPVYRALAAEMTAELAAKLKAKLPAALSAAPVAPETDRAGCTLSLVDERWVAPDDAGSNEGLLRAAFAAPLAAGLHLWPLVDWQAGWAASVARAGARLRDAPEGVALALFGMGDDGHTASLFPGSKDLGAALQSPAPYVALDASGCPGAGAWTRRLTLTPSGWRGARRRLLLLRGANKRAVFERALASADAGRWPVYALVASGDAPLEVHWAP